MAYRNRTFNKRPFGEWNIFLNKTKQNEETLKLETIY